MGRGVNKDAEALVVCIAPDVCLTPMGSAMVPVPYTITCQFDVAVETAPKVNYGGQPAFTMDSRLPTVKGDEPGTGGGIISGVNLGYCRPIEHSGTVRVHGKYIVRHGDLMAMNCAGPNGPGNTYGRIVYIGVENVGNIQETLSKHEKITTDNQSGKTVVERHEVTRNPQTGEVTETRQRTEIDPKTGEVKTQQLSVSKNPTTGTTTVEATQGGFDPQSKNYSFKQNSVTRPSGTALGSKGPVLDDSQIGKLQPDGRIYVGDGLDGEPSLEPPSEELGAGSDSGELPDNDPDLLSDEEYQNALKEQAEQQAELDAVNEELKWEAAETAADLAGLVDPTPTSDSVAAGLALRREDYLGAGLNLLSWLPYIGDAIAKPIKGTRAAKRVVKLYERLKNLTGKLDKIKDTLKRVKERIKKLKRKKIPEGELPPLKKPTDGGFIPKPNPYKKLTKQEIEDSKDSYGKLLKEHEKKLADYKKDPLAHDNKGILKNAPNDEIRKKIYEGRIRELEKQIEKHRGELQKIEEALKDLNGG